MSEQQVSSILGQRLLAALNFNPRYGFDPQRLQLYAGSAEARAAAERPTGYRLWLREKLQCSGLAQSLPGGQDLLPDIYEHSSWLRSADWFVRPRDYKELAQHICRYLDWYVDRAKPVAGERLLLDILQSRRMAIVAVPLLLVAFTMRAMLGAGSTGMLIVGSYYGLVLLFIVVLGLAYSRGGGKNYMSNKEELFLYLRAEYADRDDTPVGVEALEVASVEANDASLDLAVSRSGAVQPPTLKEGQ